MIKPQKDEFQLPSKKLSPKETQEFYDQIEKIREKHLIAFRNYKMMPFNEKIYLFRANISVHYADDMKFFVWKKFAKKGVEVIEIPGDHRSMLEYPHVKKLAASLQKALNEHGGN